MTFVINPQTLTISQDTLVRNEDGILTFEGLGSVSGDLAFHTYEAAKAALDGMIAERDADKVDAERTSEMHSSFRAAVARLRASRQAETE